MDRVIVTEFSETSERFYRYVCKNCGWIGDFIPCPKEPMGIQTKMPVPCSRCGSIGFKRGKEEATPSA